MGKNSKNIEGEFEEVPAGSAATNAAGNQSRSNYTAKPAKRGANPALAPYETLVANTAPHKYAFEKFYAGIFFASIVAIISLWIAIVSPESSELAVWAVYSVLCITCVLLISITSSSVMRGHGIVTIFYFLWLILFAVALTLALIDAMHTHILATYPRSWWEDILALPLGISSILFIVILVALSGITYRIGSMFSTARKLPMTTASIVMLLIGMYAILWPSESAFSPALRNTALLVFGAVTMAQAAFILIYIFKNGSIRFMLTNKRLIVVDRFFSEETRERPFDTITNVTVYQGYFGLKYNFGNITLTLSSGILKGRSTFESQRNVVLLGVQDPYLVKNAISAMSMQKRTFMPRDSAGGQQQRR